jgi:hypothetical protein
MFDPITISITDVTLLDEGPLVTCRWQWGTLYPFGIISAAMRILLRR